MGEAVMAKGTGKPSSYIPALDGLRALAFLFVFLAHTTGHTISKYVPAAFGVTVFFFLSGYLITTLLRKEWQETGHVALKDFYIRRGLRIFLPMYVAYAFATVLVHFTHDSQGNWQGFAAAMTYTFNYWKLLSASVALPRGFEVIWSLSVEEHFYLLFPLFFLFLMRKGYSTVTKVRVLLGLCGVALVWRYFVWTHHFPEEWTYNATDSRYDSILWGSLLAIWNNPRYDEPVAVLKKYSGLLAALGLAMILGTMFSHNELNRQVVRQTVQGAGLYFIFYFAVGHIEHWSVHWLENKALRYVGWLSYSLYLSHRVLQWAIAPYLPDKDWVITLATFAVSMVYAVAIRYALELPIQKWRARFRHTPTPVSAAMPVEGI